MPISQTTRCTPRPAASEQISKKLSEEKTLAKGKRVIPSIGRTDTPFTHPDEVLWADLEGAIGISFSETNRREIFQCGYIGIMHRNVARDGASTEDAARLCEELIYHTESLIKVIRTARSPEGRLRSEEM